MSIRPPGDGAHRQLAVERQWCLGVAVVALPGDDGGRGLLGSGEAQRLGRDSIGFGALFPVGPASKPRFAAGTGWTSARSSASCTSTAPLNRPKRSQRNEPSVNMPCAEIRTGDEARVIFFIDWS